mmetsp:Transcript_30293/g.34534  ORF Transcript_30293/g.34534 Transcript_30293/m.34534 type:complete len:255 (+) Transcript_30293:439-1203(+)
MNRGNHCLLVSLYDGPLAFRFRLFFHESLSLLSDLETSLFGLDLFVVFQYVLRYPGLGHANCDDHQTWCINIDIVLERPSQNLVETIEFVDEHLLKGVSAAELVDFVVNLVVDPRLVVVNGIILYDGVRGVGTQLVHHLDIIESNDRPTTSPTRDIRYLVGLDRHLDCVVLCDEGHLEMIAGPRDAIQQRASTVIDPDVSLRDFVEATFNATTHQKKKGAAARQKLWHNGNGSGKHVGADCIRTRSKDMIERYY